MSRLACIALIATLSLSACKQEPPPPLAPAAAPLPVAPDAPPAAAAAEVKPGAALSVGSVALGTALGGDGRITSAMDSFAPGDTIIAAIALANASAAPAEGSVGVRWLGPDGQAFNDENMARAFAAGGEPVAFRVANPKGFKPGSYKLEVSLNGSVVQTREFSIK